MKKAVWPRRFLRLSIGIGLKPLRIDCAASTELCGSSSLGRWRATHLAERYPILGGTGLELEEVKLSGRESLITALFQDEVLK